MSRAAATTLAEQLDYLEASSPFYRERIRGRRTLTELPFTTKDELRESQHRRPPFGEHLCADPKDLVRLHVTSGTTGEPVAIGLTQHDHEANSEVGGEAFAIAGLLPTDTVAHCLNYALYAGGIADHMALEASGATVVPVGVGQSKRLLDLIPRLGITAIFGTLSLPRLPGDPRPRAGPRPDRARPPPHRHRGRAGRRARRRARRDRERAGTSPSPTRSG